VFSDYLADLSEYLADEIDTNDYFKAVLENVYRNGKMLALPLYADCGIIYYRTDLLEKYGRRIPSTWQELYGTAEFIQNEERKNPANRNKFFGFVFQAKAFEILTCNFLEFIDSFGGAILTNGVPTINSDEVVNATMFLIDCLKHISSRSVLNYSEEDARGMFQSGNAVFMRNWPYAWALLNDKSTKVAGKVGVIPIPPSQNGGKQSGVLGGWVVAVSKYCKNKEAAAKLVKFLADKDQQRKRAAESSYLPTFKSLYKDRDVLNSNPFFAYLYDSLDNAVTRPSGDFGKHYPKASTEIFNMVNNILTDSMESSNIMTAASVKRFLDRLNNKLAHILRTEHNSGKDEDYIEGDGFIAKCKRLYLKVKNFLGFVNDETESDKTKSKN
jgi:trehalose/maltose transport system substrate-binding protein